VGSLDIDTGHGHQPMSISKTTLNGAIAFFIAAVPLTETYPGLHISPTVMAWLSFAAGLARLWVGISQTDADRIPAILPGSSTPQEVPAHPVPDDPKAVIVPKVP
jgi:hypothetical protein